VGIFGLVGFGAAVPGTMSLGTDMWFEAFYSPWLVAATLEVLTIEKAPICGRIHVELHPVRTGLDPVRAQQSVLPRRAGSVVPGGCAGWGDWSGGYRSGFA
jgi:hypothetical protein